MWHLPVTWTFFCVPCGNCRLRRLLAATWTCYVTIVGHVDFCWPPGLSSGIYRPRGLLPATPCLPRGICRPILACHVDFCQPPGLPRGNCRRLPTCHMAFADHMNFCQSLLACHVAFAGHVDFCRPHGRDMTFADHMNFCRRLHACHMAFIGHIDILKKRFMWTCHLEHTMTYR